MAGLRRITLLESSTWFSGGGWTVLPPQITRHGFSASVCVSAFAFVVTTLRFSIETRRLLRRSLSRCLPSGVLKLANTASPSFMNLFALVISGGNWSDILSPSASSLFRAGPSLVTRSRACVSASPAGWIRSDKSNGGSPWMTSLSASIGLLGSCPGVRETYLGAMPKPSCFTTAETSRPTSAPLSSAITTFTQL